MNKALARAAAGRAKSGTADPLDQLIWYLGRAYYTYVGLLECVLADLGLDKFVRPGMGHVLFTLFQSDGCRIKEIAARSQLACSTLTGLLARMEATKLIERRRDERDGRVVRVHLTALARSLEPRCREAAQQLDELLRGGMTERAVKQTKRHLQTMIEIMRSASRLPVRAARRAN